MIRNGLWKPEGNKPHFGIRLAPKRLNDPVCQYCSKKQTCSPGPCLFITRINGNAPSKEALMSDLCDKETEYKDYKETLSELVEDRENKFKNAIDINNVKRRSIAILLLAGIQQKDIAIMFSMSLRQIVRICKHIK